jgi:Fe-S-cluster containining protein
LQFFSQSLQPTVREKACRGTRKRHPQRACQREQGRVVHCDRPSICHTYPFSVALGGTSQPLGKAVDREGLVRDIDREDGEALAATLKERAVRELEEARAVRDGYEPLDHNGVIVFDSEGPKRSDGTPL